MSICEICGNEVPLNINQCPHCGNKIEVSSSKFFRIETLNLEAGMPTAAEAEKKLFNSLSKFFRKSINVIKIIHGYGSSGVGGKLKLEIRKSLLNHKLNGPLKFIIFGENFTDRDPETKKLIQKYPDIIKDPDFKKGNKGITIVAK